MKTLDLLRPVVLVCALIGMSAIRAQQQPLQHPVSATTPLSRLIEEAKSANPQVLAAIHAYKAAANVPKRAAALPDTQLMVQHLSVGSPRPFAGYTNSDFAYIGIGASQEFPYPGKRKLRAEVALREADALQARSESSTRQVIESLKTAYFRLAYVQE